MQVWLARQIQSAFPWDAAPRYLLRDRDASYGQAFRDHVEAMGIKEVATFDRRRQEGAPHLIPRSAIALYVRHPSYPNTGKRWLVRELPKNRRRTEVPVSFSGSAGAVGRHDNTPNRAAIRAGAVSNRH